MRSTVERRELYSALCGDLDGKEIQKRRDICIRTADSLCCTVETNTLQSNYTSIKINFKNKIKLTQPIPSSK